VSGCTVVGGSIFFLYLIFCLLTCLYTPYTRDGAMCGEEERALGREMITLGVYRPVVFVKDSLILLDILQGNSSCFPL
jgi:hypothetical protein